MSLEASTRGRMARRSQAIAPPAAQRRTVPFDYAFRFLLTGDPEKVQNQTVTISIEAAFNAVSIGYGAISTVKRAVFPREPTPPPPPPAAPVDELRTIVFAPKRGFFDTPVGDIFAAASEAFGEPFDPANGHIGPRTAEALSIGLRLNPAFAERILLGDANRLLTERPNAPLFQVVAPPPEQITFKYALFDQATGREFQSEPILNIAGLGASDGGRPFRYFAQPIEFAPRSVIRMEITELSTFRGELHVSLQGYKILGAPGTPTANTRRR
jgi:hypothetical protein